MSDGRFLRTAFLAIPLSVALVQCSGGGGSPPSQPQPSSTPSVIATDAAGPYNLVNAADNAYGEQTQCIPDPSDNSSPACYLLAQTGAAITSSDVPSASSSGGLEVQYANATIYFGETLQNSVQTIGRLWTLVASQPQSNGDLVNPLSGTMDAVITPAGGAQFACTFSVSGSYDDKSDTGDTSAATYQVTYNGGSCSGGSDSGGTLSLAQQGPCGATSMSVNKRRRPFLMGPNHVVNPC